ncbi:glycosyltransferase family 2 protein [Brasilonema sp. UFV-L1]|uniref:glycosyltransferase family 2 protein n=1 Tax=Brasilonema sp. UFV-L1 TaxID=2234130 RepID=UPI00145F3520|nr:glycosyltransferase family 2 protein [Brasilonema sp. UFV-L1]NMG11518.1 glycosyl transferase family 2 [Brasilonema sp. UFV-L1]
MKNHTPLVSVIMNFLNAEKFIQQAIESVFSQIYHNWELLLIDDGSTDTSTSIALRYAQKNPTKVRYLEHENHQNLGKSSSRNLGIHHAKGDYIAFLDADDIWLPQKLERQISILIAQPEIGMVCGPTLMWFSWTGKPDDFQRNWKREIGVQLDTLMKPPKLLTLFLQRKASTPATCSVLLRREVVEDVGGFDESIQFIYEDQIFFTKVYLKAPVFVESGCWDKYRQHPDSCCHIAQKSGEYNPYGLNPAELIFLKWLEKYLLEQEVKDLEIWQALKKALHPYQHPILYHATKRTQKLKFFMKNQLKTIAKKTLPVFLQRLLVRSLGQTYYPPVGHVQFGDLRRPKPISWQFGYDRGLPIDRYYIEKFLACQSDDIHGWVMEIGDNFYTCKFGGERVTKSDVLHVKEGNPDATIVGDLSKGDNIPSDSFDCLILTQTLQLLYDVRSGLQTINRILKPGGVALVTLPSITSLSDDEWDSCWCWGFTTVSAQRLFEEVFPKENVKVETHGNVLAATAFLQGLAIKELHKQELDNCDPAYPVLITVRAVKPEIKL